MGDTGAVDTGRGIIVIFGARVTAGCIPWLTLAAPDTDPGLTAIAVAGPAIRRNIRRMTQMNLMAENTVKAGIKDMPGLGQKIRYTLNGKRRPEKIAAGNRFPALFTG
jgi:hypothetical protein